MTFRTQNAAVSTRIWPSEYPDWVIRNWSGSDQIRFYCTRWKSPLSALRKEWNRRKMVNTQRTRGTWRLFRRRNWPNATKQNRSFRFRKYYFWMATFLSFFVGGEIGRKLWSKRELSVFSQLKSARYTIGPSFFGNKTCLIVSVKLSWLWIVY